MESQAVFQAVFQAETQAKIVCIELGPRLLLMMMMGELGNFVTRARTIEESDQVEIVVAAAVHFYLKISRTKEVRCPFASLVRSFFAFLRFVP